MKKLVLATMAIVLFVSNTNAQEKLSAEDKERLQEIVKKVTSVAEEKARVVTFELNYKESFELANFAVDEENELAKKLSSSLDEATFNALKGNVKLTYGNGDFEVFATDDMNNIGNAILAHAKERLVKGLYMPRSLDGSLSYGQEKEETVYSNCSLRTGDMIGKVDKESFIITVDKEKLLNDFSVIAKESGLNVNYNRIEILRANPDEKLNYFGLYASSEDGYTKTTISLDLNENVFSISKTGATVTCSSVDCTGTQCSAYNTGEAWICTACTKKGCSKVTTVVIKSFEAN